MVEITFFDKIMLIQLSIVWSFLCQRTKSGLRIGLSLSLDRNFGGHGSDPSMMPMEISAAQYGKDLGKPT
jgi:hypothetical protein